MLDVLQPEQQTHVRADGGRKTVGFLYLLSDGKMMLVEKCNKSNGCKYKICSLVTDGRYREMKLAGDLFFEESIKL